MSFYGKGKRGKDESAANWGENHGREGSDFLTHLWFFTSCIIIILLLFSAGERNQITSVTARTNCMSLTGLIAVSEISGIIQHDAAIWS